MKLKVSILLLGILLISPIVLAEKVNNNDNDTITYQEEKTKKNKIRHWSITFNGGMAFLDGDIAHTNKLQILPTSYVNFAFSTQLEYLINPIWGLYLQYSYLPYSASIKEKTNIKALSHDVTINGTINLINLFRLNKTKTFKWGLNINVGLGFAFYSGDSYVYHEKRKFDQLLQKNIVKGRSIVIPVGFSVEYSPIEPLGIFLQGEYRMYQKDNLENVYGGQFKDAIAYLGLGLRYKIGANKNHKHAKTYSIEDEISTQKKNEIIQKVQKQEKELDSIKQILYNLEITSLDTLDTDLDGVPDKFDKHPNTPIGSFVNNNGEPLTEEEISKILGTYSKPFVTIFYELNSSHLSYSDKVKISQIALELSENPSYKIKIIGYCDNTGTDKYNMKLSLYRAKVIRDILIDTYKIKDNRITIEGKGKMITPRNNYIVNRRCDIFIIK